MRSLQLAAPLGVIAVHTSMRLARHVARLLALLLSPAMNICFPSVPSALLSSATLSRSFDSAARHVGFPMLVGVQALVRVIAIFGVIAASSVLAQPAVPSGKSIVANGANQHSRASEHRVSFATAATRADAGDLDGAERQLATLSKANPNSANWHIETAQRLLELAIRLNTEGKPKAVPSLALRALDHLAQVEKITSDVKTRASARSMTGFIHERFRGNHSAALESYQAAAQLSTGALKAKSAAERLRYTNPTAKSPGN